MQKKLYVGCGLTGAPEEFVRQVFQLRNDLRPHFEVLDFWSPSYIGEPKDPRMIFTWDIKQLEESDFMLGICDHQSFGLGYETREELALEKRVLLVAQQDRVISEFPAGISDPLLTFKLYKEWPEIIDLAVKHLL